MKIKLRLQDIAAIEGIIVSNEIKSKNLQKRSKQKSVSISDIDLQVDSAVKEYLEYEKEEKNNFHSR
jgi:hypothetical protein